MARLVSVADALGPVLASARVLRPVSCPIADALGTVLAGPVFARKRLPERPVALRPGLAVMALELVGASPGSPILLPRRPQTVGIGDVLPDGCDAVLPEEAGSEGGASFEITQAVVPGEGVRLAGHDLEEGTLIARRGTEVTPSLRLALQEAQVAEVEVVAPAACVEPGPEAECGWLTAVLSQVGCRSWRAGVSAPTKPDLIFEWAHAGTPYLALRPGDASSIAVAGGGRISIRLPPRFDGMVSGFLALALPAIAALTGRRIRCEHTPLTRKIASMIGATELVLLETTPDGLAPLATGEVTLQALAAASAFALLPPQTEGFPSGHMIEVTRFGALLVPEAIP